MLRNGMIFMYMYPVLREKEVLIRKFPLWDNKEIGLCPICKDNKSLLQFANRNGAMFGFHLTNPDVQNFIQEFYQCALTKECIAPEGSSRENHRQDQAVFTILYYYFIHKHGLPYEDQYFGIQIHNDID